MKSSRVRVKISGRKGPAIEDAFVHVVIDVPINPSRLRVGDNILLTEWVSGCVLETFTIASVDWAVNVSGRDYVQTFNCEPFSLQSEGDMLCMYEDIKENYVVIDVHASSPTPPKYYTAARMLTKLTNRAYTPIAEDNTEFVKMVRAILPGADMTGMYFELKRHKGVAVSLVRLFENAFRGQELDIVEPEIK